MKESFLINMIPLIQTKIFENRIPIKAWEMAEIAAQDQCQPDLTKLTWEPIELPLLWGRAYSTCWFKTVVTIPEYFPEIGVELLLNPNCEGLIYLNGKPFHGLDSNRLEIALSTIRPGETVEIMLEAYHGPTELPTFFEYAELAVVNPKVKELFYHLTFGCNVLNSLDSNTTEYTDLLNELFRATKLIDTSTQQANFLKTVQVALDYLNQGIYARQLSAADKPEVWLTGHSHIDVA